jgi:uncharacterized oligopeptide transporter (OPT) family protein
VMGWTATAYMALAITIGGVVCIAAANAGNTSQDLKTGFLVGATPRKQQLSLLVGVIASVFFIGGTLILMNKGLEEFRTSDIAIDINALPQGVARDQKGLDRDAVPVKTEATTETRDVSQHVLLNALGSSVLPDGKYLYNPATGKVDVQWIQGIGSANAAAPQARLMSTVISGILTRRLPWGLVFLGVFLVIAVELLGVRSLSFAVGAYLSIATTLAIFCGGIVRWLAERGAEKAAGGDHDSEVSPGSLYASGLIAAGGVIGLLGVVLKVLEKPPVPWIPRIPENAVQFHRLGIDLLHNPWVSVIMFALLAFSLFYFARKPLETKVKVGE